jgi:Xaa-Pro aminopeptidase
MSMRRGLIARSLVELPDAVLDTRLARMRVAMRDAGLDALLVYTNNTRAAGVSWLTGFVPYWSEALLVVPPERDPVLVVALTYRVKSWIERVSRVAEVIHTPRIGLEAARLLAAAKGDAAVGIVDREGLPAGVGDDLREGGQHLSWHDASTLFAVLRAQADPAEIALAVKAAEIARQALDRAAGDAVDLGARVAAVEREARANGAEEIYVAAAPDLARGHHLARIEGAAVAGASFALRATVAYKGAWIRMTRTFGAVGGEAAAERFAAAVAQLPDPRGFAEFSSWSVEGCRIAQPLEPLMGSRIDDSVVPAPRSLVSVQACLTVAGAPVLLGAPALLGSADEAASLLVSIDL